MVVPVLPIKVKVTGCTAETGMVAAAAATITAIIMHAVKTRLIFVPSFFIQFSHRSFKRVMGVTICT
jgi:hypothetical protein